MQLFISSTLKSAFSSSMNWHSYALAAAPARCVLVAVETRTSALKYDGAANYDRTYNYGVYKMANLRENAAWESGIYQLETTDPVVGGADGISNKQAIQLANRTSYLKGEIETLKSSSLAVLVSNKTRLDRQGRR